MGFRLQDIKLRTAISLLIVLVTVLTSIALAAGIFFSLSEGVTAQGRDSVNSRLKTAAALFATSTSGYEVGWTDSDDVSTIKVWGLLPYHDHDLVDRISKVSGSEVSIYVMNRDTGALGVSTSTLEDGAGQRLLGLSLPEDSPPHDAATAGETFIGEEVIAGADHFVAYHPILSDSGLVGVLFVALPRATVSSGLLNTMIVVLSVAGIVTMVLSLMGYLASRIVTRPLPRLVVVMDAIAKGQLDILVPHIPRTPTRSVQWPER